MVEISDSLRTLFTGVVEERDGDYVVSIPSSEVEQGDLAVSEAYRVGLIGVEETTDVESTQTQTRERDSQAKQSAGPDQQPVVEGETYEVEIESLGEKGDGIAYVDGFVLMVSDVDIGERVVVRVETVLESVGFADVVKRVNPGV
ncbi:MULTISPECIES: TRAM domain-containing protein [Haloferacaceae]|uniref:TRAM domain-containing protein n=2 Tax=Haloferacaceae TaxID=1644056 RepID=A0ABD6DAS7_9EURY|nr:MULTISPECIES: TRAM domain-containing protein [Halorubraceae]